jgi:hypothetical protein
MTARFVAQIFKILKKWLLRLVRSSASLFLSFLALLCRSAARPSKLGDTLTRFSTGALQSAIAGENPLICSSFLPSGQPLLEVAGDPPSPSDVPYSGTHERSLRRDTQMPSTHEAYPSAKPYRPFLHSMSSLCLSQESGGSYSPPRIPYDQKGKGVERGGKESLLDNVTSPKHPLQASNSPLPSPLLGLHGLPKSHRTPSVNSGASIYSFTRSMAGSESRQAEYRPHTGAVHSRSVSIHSGSFANLHYGSPHTIPIASDLPAQAVPISGPGIDSHVHFTAPPASDEQPGAEVMRYDGPQIGAMVVDHDGVKRYTRCIPR